MGLKNMPIFVILFFKLENVRFYNLKRLMTIDMNIEHSFALLDKGEEPI